MFVVYLLFLAFDTSYCQKNEATLYDPQNQQGDQITLSVSSDLKWKQFDDKASSVCVSGLMLFYSLRDFFGDVEYVHGEDKNCTNLKMDERVSPVRHPGSLSDIRNESITLYSNTGFFGDDLRVYKNYFVGASARSLIVTGGSNWTVWDQTIHEGKSVCLVAPKPEEKLPSFLVSASDIHDFNPVVRSGIKGCDPEIQNVFELTLFDKQGP